MTRDWCKSIWLLDANIFRYARWLQSSSRHYWLNQKCIKCDVPLGPTTVDYILQNMAFYAFFEKASLVHQPLKSRHIFSNLHAWIYIFTATLPWKKETQQQKLGRRKFAQCPFAVIFITFKKDDWCRNNIGGEEEGGILRWQKKYDVAIFSHFRCCLLKPFRFMAELAWPM